LQVKVAAEMIKPSSDENTVLQLNMGEGKSSVIVPLVAAALADGTKMVRIVVLKPLATQMFQLLVERLGSLANRRIVYIPFSRDVRLDLTKLQVLEGIYRKTVQDGAILLVQPEHVLSYKLMSIDLRTTAKSDQDILTAHRSIELQRWLTENSRDVLDESDEILHIRYQLVYTSGVQKPLDDHPDRWTTTQQLLTLVQKHASNVKQQYPYDVQFDPRDGEAFSGLRLLPSENAHAYEYLRSLLVEDSMKGHLLNLNLLVLATPVHDAARRFITSREISSADRNLVRDESGSMWKGLLLLRGLLALDILRYVLTEKRYRVNYGLDLSRSLLAVPYRAKVG
jgi:hypothetical protein